MTRLANSILFVAFCINMIAVPWLIILLAERVKRMLDAHAVLMTVVSQLTDPNQPPGPVFIPAHLCEIPEPLWRRIRTAWHRHIWCRIVGHSLTRKMDGTLLCRRCDSMVPQTRSAPPADRRG